MYDKLKALIKNSYCPKSKFRVASIVVMKDGNSFEGVNVENPSFKDGLCAEQVAIGSAIADGYTDGDFEKIYILSDADYPITPCFLCRQQLVEFFEMDKKVISYSNDGTYKEFKISALCPHAFTKGDLK